MMNTSVTRARARTHTLCNSTTPVVQSFLQYKKLDILHVVLLPVFYVYRYVSVINGFTDARPLVESADFYNECKNKMV